MHYSDAGQNVFERDLKDGESEIKKGNEAEANLKVKVQIDLLNTHDWK